MSAKTISLTPREKHIMTAEIAQRFGVWIQENDVKIILERHKWHMSEEALLEINNFAASNAKEAAIGVIKKQLNIEEPEARKLMTDHKSIIDAMNAYKSKMNMEAQMEEAKKSVIARREAAKGDAAVSSGAE